jgi:hypothetical protein
MCVYRYLHLRNKYTVNCTGTAQNYQCRHDSQTIRTPAYLLFVEIGHFLTIRHKPDEHEHATKANPKVVSRI